MERYETGTNKSTKLITCFDLQETQNDDLTLMFHPGYIRYIIISIWRILLVTIHPTVLTTHRVSLT